MISCTRRIQFCAGHRVLNHETKCANIHGHNYVVLIEAIGIDTDLDSLGRVIDFSVLKEKIGGWIDEKWDHTFIAYDRDVSVIEKVGPENKKPIFILPFNPTAENMAKYLLHTVCPQVLLGTGVKVKRIEIWETENCKAEACL